MTSTYKIPIHDGDLKIKPEFLTPDDRNERREENGAANGDGKKEKQRGRNKDRLGIVHK